MEKCVRRSLKDLACFSLHRSICSRGSLCASPRPGARSFIVETKVNGKTRRAALGKYPNLTVEQARKLAQEPLGLIASGCDPEAEKREAQAVGVTLGQAFDAYLLARKDLKPRTIGGYRDAMRGGFEDWQGTALVDITKDMVERRHRQIAETRGEAHKAWVGDKLKIDALLGESADEALHAPFVDPAGGMEGSSDRLRQHGSLGVLDVVSTESMTRCLWGDKASTLLKPSGTLRNTANRSGAGAPETHVVLPGNIKRQAES